jgi:hypothetical protein
MLNFMDSLVLITSRLKKKKKTKGYPSNLGGQIFANPWGQANVLPFIIISNF